MPPPVPVEYFREGAPSPEPEELKGRSPCLGGEIARPLEDFRPAGTPVPTADGGGLSDMDMDMEYCEEVEGFR